MIFKDEFGKFIGDCNYSVESGFDDTIVVSFDFANDGITAENSFTILNSEIFKKVATGEKIIPLMYRDYGGRTSISNKNNDVIIRQNWLGHCSNSIEVEISKEDWCDIEEKIFRILKIK